MEGEGGKGGVGGMHKRKLKREEKYNNDPYINECFEL